MPGLIVDRLDDVIVMQPSSASMDRLSENAVAALRNCLSPRAIVRRGDGPFRRLDGLDERVDVIGDLPDGPVRVDAALELARRAAVEGDTIDRCNFAQGDAFGDLEARRGRGEHFDMVIRDPPAFVRTKKDIKSGARGYRKLTRLADADGWLAIASCSHHVSEELLPEQIRLGLRDAGRDGRVVRRSGAGPDHPIHPGHLESTYLKFFCRRLD